MGRSATDEPDPTVVEAARLTLLEAPRLSAAIAAERLPPVPGLYAIFAGEATRAELRLPEYPEQRPIYVGKAEDSFLKRDVQTHFKGGKTGQSTLRRSLAALLREPLELVAQPRNPAKPGHFDRFGMDPASEVALQQWMGDHLEISTWTKPAGVHLLGVERALLKLWTPPLNWTDNPRRWPHLKAVRRRMADDARKWIPGTA